MLRRIINLTRLINHVTKNSTNKNNKRRAHQVCARWGNIIRSDDGVRWVR